MDKQPTFKKIALIGRQRVDHITETLHSLKEFLLSRQVEVMCETDTAAMLGEPDTQAINKDELEQHCQMIIVVGGDGSFLNAARIAATQNLPVLGVNRGTLGFLTDIHPDAFEEISEIIQGNYITEERFLLEAKIPDHEPQTALNDVVLLPGGRPQMIGFEVYINDQFAYHLKADGLIIASPTGSTAYSLSVGGPILHPQLDAITVVPMSPHTLSNRPIVVRGDAKISLVIDKDNKTPPHLSCDGQERLPTTPGMTIEVKKHPKTFRLIHPKTYNYYETLRTKLDWKG